MSASSLDKHEDEQTRHGEAEMTVVSEKVFFTLSTGKLEKPSKVLHGPASQKLEVLGQFGGNLSHGSRHIRQTIFVVKSLHKKLLGLPAITALDLVHQSERIYHRCLRFLTTVSYFLKSSKDSEPGGMSIRSSCKMMHDHSHCSLQRKVGTVSST